MSDDLVKRLHSLHKQATVERSHFYVGGCAKDAIHRIEELEAKLATRGSEMTDEKIGNEMTDEEKLDLALVIEDIVEHEDESCTVTVRFGPTVHKNLVETGLSLVFRCAANGLSIDEALDQIISK
jgi:hypothetical protein